MSIKDTVYECIVELHEAGRSPSPAMVMSETGYTKQQVNDAINALYNDDELIQRVSLGVYIPQKPRTPDRAISATAIPAGLVKVDIGDSVIDLTRTEARLLGCLLGGFSIGFGR